MGYTSCWPWFVFVVIPVVLLFGWKGWEWLETIEAVFFVLAAIVGVICRVHGPLIKKGKGLQLKKAKSPPFSHRHDVDGYDPYGYEDAIKEIHEQKRANNLQPEAKE